MITRQATGQAEIPAHPPPARVLVQGRMFVSRTGDETAARV
jgi:hypothetical protein